MKDKTNNKDPLQALMDELPDNYDPIIPSVDESKNIFKDSTRDAVGYLNLPVLKERCIAEAEDIITYLVDFYLSGEILDNPYVKKRMDDDKYTIADLLLNMRTSEHAIAKLLEVIDEGGSVVPRNFEVLSKLQTSKMEIVKHYEAVKTNIENNYKALRAEYNEKFSDSEDSPSIGYGHKAMLRGLINNMDEFEKNEIIKEEIKQEGSLPKGVIVYDANRIRKHEEDPE